MKFRDLLFQNLGVEELVSIFIFAFRKEGFSLPEFEKCGGKKFQLYKVARCRWINGLANSNSDNLFELWEEALSNLKGRISSFEEANCAKLKKQKKKQPFYKWNFIFTLIEEY